jgi:hypothetical protein
VKLDGDIDTVLGKLTFCRIFWISPNFGHFDPQNPEFGPSKLPRKPDFGHLAGFWTPGILPPQNSLGIDPPENLDFGHFCHFDPFFDPETPIFDPRTPDFGQKWTFF